MKKLAIILGSLLGLLIIAAIVIPLVVDVDKYRPQIVETANQHINGKLELGKLKLSLWGQIRVDVAGVELKDAKGNQVVAVKDAFFHLPFFSIFSGSPLLTFKMQNPVVNVIKDKSGKLNVLSLVREDKSADGDTQPPATPGAQGSGGPGGDKQDTNLPGIATRARLGVELRDALVTYKDLATGMDTQVKDLNLVLRDISLSRPTELELWANLETQMGKSLLVRGPARVTGSAHPKLSGGKFEEATAELKVNLDDLEIIMGELFHKSKGVPANLEGAFRTTAQEAKIEKLDLRFHNAEVRITGGVTNLDAPVVNLDVKSNEIALNGWSELVPMLKEYELGGVATLSASASGPADKLNYQADLAVKNLTAKSPRLKAKPTIDAVVKVVTDRVDNMTLTMKAPGNDLRVTGKVASFTKPRADFQVLSSGMDLDQLIDFPPPGKSTAAKASGGEPASGGAGSGAPQTAGGKDPAADDYDAMVQPMRENPILAATQALVNVNIKFIKAYGVSMNDIQSKMTLKNLVASIDQFGMGLFKGSVKADASVNLQPKTPTYKFGTQIAGLDMKEAVSSQMQLFKNTVLGIAQFKMEGSGSSFNPQPATRNLNAKGSMRVDNATFASIDVAKMAAEALNKGIEKVGEKIPAVKGKSIKTNLNKESRYDYISSDFTIQGGKFSAPNFHTKALPNAGIDLRGNTVVGMIDYGLSAQWLVIDTFNMLHAKDLSVEQAGVKVESILAEKNEPVKFPVTVTGTLSAPVYSYTEVPEYLVKVALKNTTGAAQAKAKAEVQKRVEEKVKEIAPAPVKDAVKGLGKKLFGR